METSRIALVAGAPESRPTDDRLAAHSAWWTRGPIIDFLPTKHCLGFPVEIDPGIAHGVWGIKDKDNLWQWWDFAP